MSQYYIPVANTAHKRVPPDPWEHVRPLITRLYVDEGKTLSEVMRTLAKFHNHLGTVKQYKSRIRKWGLDKNHKEKEMLAIVYQKRKRHAVGKASAFSVRGRPVTAIEVFKYFRRKGVPNPETKASTLDVVPETIRCWTPTPAEEPRLAESDTNLEGSHQWLLKSAHTNDFNSMESVPTTRADTQLQQTFAIKQIRQLLSFSPEIATLEVPCPLLPPNALLLPERLFFFIKAYHEGLIRAETFITDDRGQLEHISEAQGASVNNFGDLCTSASKLISGGLHLEGRRILSRVFVLLKDIVQEQHPSALDLIITAVLDMSSSGLPEIGNHLLEYTSEMAANLLNSNHPWRQILCLIRHWQGPDRKPLLGAAWLCTINTLQNVYGPLHPYALSCNINYINEELEPVTAGRLLQGLLEKFEQDMDNTDYVVIPLRWSYGLCLCKQKRYAEAISIMHEIGEYSKSYITMQGLSAWCYYEMGHMHEAEMNMRKDIEFGATHYGRDDPTTLRYMDILWEWLHEWGRVEESKN